MRWWPLLTAVLVSVPGPGRAAEKNAELERAQESFEALRYSEAGKSLEAAWAKPANPLETVLKILELQAVVTAALGQQDRARALFRTLLYLSPKFELPEGELGPKVMSLYYEAKGRQSVDGWLTFEPGPIVRDEQRVHRVSVRVADRQKLGKSVRFHSRLPGTPWTQQLVPVGDSPPELTVEAPSVEWWAELLGDSDRVLARTGTETSPLLAVSGDSLTPGGRGARPPQLAGRAGGSILRPAAYAAAGVGALAAVVGIVFGVQANNLRSQITNAERDADGRVIGITREKALALNRQMQTPATAANTLFVASAVLVATGVVLFVLSRDTQLTASPGGVAVRASLW